VPEQLEHLDLALGGAAHGFVLCFFDLVQLWVFFEGMRIGWSSGKKKKTPPPRRRADREKKRARPRNSPSDSRMRLMATISPVTRWRARSTVP
jgi:hypothetical protein